MLPAAKRHGFQFSLRTLIVAFGLLTAALGWLGRELKVIHERNVTRDWIVTKGGSTISRTQWKTPFGDGEYLVHVPRWRTWLGDQPMVSLKLSQNCELADVERVQAVFPEARVDYISSRIRYDKGSGGQGGGGGNGQNKAVGTGGFM